MRIAEQRAKEWQAKFAILADWKIAVSDPLVVSGQVSTNPDFPCAVLHPWVPSDETPEDFYLHEFLHVALRAYKRLPESGDMEAEERLVRDICVIVREGLPCKLS